MSLVGENVFRMGGSLTGVLVWNSKIIVLVTVGVRDFVKVALGVGVSVAVDVGSALAVWVDAASAVCAMILLIAYGSIVGTGGGEAVNTGAHAMTRVNAANQNAYFVLRFNMDHMTTMKL